MSLVSLMLLAAGGWIELAAICQDYGQAWAYRACSGLHGLCHYHTPLLFGAIASATVFFVVDVLRRS
jgi:hypothetical protein